MFKNAKPVWIENKECEMNVHAVFRTEGKIPPDATLHLAGTAFYRVYVNNGFVGFGPARTAGGYVREDIFPLGQYMAEECDKCEIVIEAVGYYCHSLATVWQPSYIIAEIQRGGQAVKYTGRDFVGYLPECKVQKVERYSVQRHFCEVWDYRTCKSLTEAEYEAPTTVLNVSPQVIDRRVPYPLYEDRDLEKARISGIVEFDETKSYIPMRYSWPNPPKWWGLFDWDEIQYHPYTWIQRQKQIITAKDVKLPVVLQQGEYVVMDFGQIEAGFIKASIEGLAESDVVIGFSEYYEGEEFKFPNMNVHNVLEYFISQDDLREVMSFEPYTFRFVMLAVKEGSITLNSLGVKTYMFDISNVDYLDCDNETLNAIYRAGVRTFAHNSVDLYMDCPSRERAGWLCDSYFTAKTEYALTGETKVEDAFLENYRLFQDLGDYPKGALPECYPSDASPGGIFIPQWTMWYILEVEEYVHKRGHEDMAEEFRKSIYDLLDFYRRYENEDGLLECLPSWNFVEWSKANEWTKDVNYPTNFLYAQALECIYRLYGDGECLRRSQAVREKAVQQSFNGRFFLDHAVRDEEGKLCIQEHSSEACQYYAILFGGIDIHSKEYQELKHLVLSVFSPNRKNAMPEIFEVNAFIGAYLRMEVLLKMEEYELVLRDIEAFFGRMEEKTGTLWEYREFKGSQDHGFASYALVVISKAQYLK